MVFGREGLAGEVTEAVARVVPAGNVQVAVHPRDEARWICIVADGPTRYFELDRGLQRDDFPWLEEQGFQPIPSPVSRSTASVCRSYAKKAMGYDTARGDRILVLLCPHDSWPKLRPTWPPADTAGK